MSTKSKSLEAQEIQRKIIKYKRLLENHPQLSARTIPIHLTLGKLYERAGEKAAAIQEFSKVALFYSDHGQIARLAIQILNAALPGREAAGPC